MKRVKSILPVPFHALIIAYLLFGCSSKENKTQSNFPEFTNLELSSNTHNLFLNLELFPEHENPKSAIAQQNSNLIFNEFNSVDKVLFNNLSNQLNYDVVKGNDSIQLNLSFKCEKCQSAYIGMNTNNRKDANQIIDSLISNKEPYLQKLEILNVEAYFKWSGYKKFEDWWESIYLIVRDSTNTNYTYEIASILADGKAPEFVQNKYGNNKELKANEGLVAIDIEDFEGNDYDGYNVPLKGVIKGDVAKLLIDNKNIKFTKGDFFKRMKLKLFTGYNQIPIEIQDKFGNTTKAHLEISLERIRNNPQINIENDIDIEN